MTNEQFDNTMQSVILRLPNEVVATLTDFWESTPTTVPGEGDELPAPQIRLVTGSPNSSPEAGGFLRCNPHPGCLAFNGDFLAEAPVEVVESVIAEALADSYLKSIDPTRCPWDQAAPDEDVTRLMSEWGFSREETAMYVSAQRVKPRNAVAFYYAYRFATYGKPPHTSADIDSIVAELGQKKCGHLEAALRSNSRNKVRVFDFSTKAITEIPRSELAPGYVLADVEGVDGPVYINIHQVGPGGQPKHGGLSKEFKRVIRHCMNLVGNADGRNFEKHVHAFLCDSDPTPELMVYFRSALVFGHFATKQAVSIEQRRRLWQWIVHCSMTEPSTVIETWEWQSGERELLEPVANYYFTCEYEEKFRKLFDPEKIFPLPLNSTTTSRRPSCPKR